MTSEKRTLLGVIALLGVALLAVYGSALFHGYVMLDDDILVFANPAAQHFVFGSIWHVFTHFDPELYIPLTFLSYQLTWLISGGSPFAFHLIDLILHGINAGLVMWLLFLLTDRKWTSILCGLLFALHPLNTETVVWIAARKDTLSTMFFLLSVIFYLRSSELQKSEMSSRPYGLSIAFFVLALLSKAMVLTLPLVLLLIDYLQGRKFDKKLWIEKIPYFALSLIFGIVALVGKQSSLTHTSPLTLLLTAAKSTTDTLARFFVPMHLSVLYPYHDTVSITSSDFWLPVAVITIIIAAILFFVRHNRAVIFGTAFFVLTLAPTFFNIIKAEELYIGSDRYAYIPMIGLLFLIATFLPKRAVTPLLCTTIIVAGFLAHAQSNVWTNTESLFVQTLKYYPQSSLAHNKVGSQLLNRNRIDDAEAEFNASLAIKDNPRAHYNLGLVALEHGDEALSYDENSKAVALDENYAPAHVNLCYLESQRGNITTAIAHCKKAISSDPQIIDARINLAVLYIKQGTIKEALQVLDEVLAIDPQNADALLLRKQF